MECLEGNQICEWADAHGLSCGENVELRLADWRSVYRAQYANGQQSGREADCAADLISRLGSWDECLVSITLWGVWPSGEDWPTFYAWRGARGEKRSVQKAPGHRFDGHEGALLTELLALIMENAWDADILCAQLGRADRIYGKISHDEWYEIRERTGPFR